ncbi:Hypothetical protein GLP15_4391 [Giardia lamblia P15]|uniref:Uncharacterized protein n=1 Tax=Giardia intestinalis (strain P15) TaxID=658858 RepID=E1F7M7_GIAIA|nr:Hypothetical protein GLP15_4391 [Giardia lamblia P15]
MIQTLYRQSHWNGEGWVHVHVYTNGQEKRLALYDLDIAINTSAFLAICSFQDKSYIYDYGTDALYACSVYDPLTSDESLSSQLHAIRLAKVLLLRQLRPKVFNDRQTSSISPCSPGAMQKPQTPLLKLMHNIDTLQPYERLASRLQPRSLAATPVVSAAACAINQDTLMLFCVQRGFACGNSTPIYTNHILKVGLSGSDSERLKLQSQFERVHSLIYCKGSLFTIVEQSVTLPKTEEDLEEDRRRAEELAKIMRRLSKMNPEDEEYKRLEPYYRSSVEPFETIYALCRIDINTFSVEILMKKKSFMKAFASDLENTITVVMPTYDLSSTIAIASYNAITRELTLSHPVLDPWFVLDRTLLESSYLQEGILRNPALSLEIELSSTKVCVRPADLSTESISQ